MFKSFRIAGVEKLIDRRLNRCKRRDSGTTTAQDFSRDAACVAVAVGQPQVAQRVAEGAVSVRNQYRCLHGWPRRSLAAHAKSCRHRLPRHEFFFLSSPTAAPINRFCRRGVVVCDGHTTPVLFSSKHFIPQTTYRIVFLRPPRTDKLFSRTFFPFVYWGGG